MKILPDQKDVQTENAQLYLRSKNLSAQLTAKGMTVAAPPNGSLLATDCLAANASLKAHVAELEGMLSNPSGVKAMHGAKSTANGDTLTARVLASKGVKSLAELAALPVNDDGISAVSEKAKAAPAKAAPAKAKALTLTEKVMAARASQPKTANLD